MLLRDGEGQAAEQLRERGVEPVIGSFDDFDSLVAAATGVDAMFAMTTPAGGVATEVAQGHNVADAALAAGVGHFGYSSVSGADRATGIPHFDSKFESET